MTASVYPAYVVSPFSSFVILLTACVPSNTTNPSPPHSSILVPMPIVRSFGSFNSGDSSPDVVYVTLPIPGSSVPMYVRLIELVVFVAAE